MPMVAIPAADSVFTGWSGACAGTGSCPLTMTADRQVTATFELKASAIPVGTPIAGILTAQTTWSTAQSPFVLTGNVFVSSGVTLTIEPGVVVRVQAGKALRVEGTLVARGTSGQPLTFTSDSASPARGDWVGIQFTDSSTDATFDASGNYTGGSILEYATVEYAGGGVAPQPAVSIDLAAPFIARSTIRNNLTGGIRVINGTGSGNITIRILQNLISNNGGTGVSVAGNAVIAQNTVLNHANGPGISITPVQSAEVTGNLIKNNAGGLFISGNTTVSRNNVLDNAGLGINANGTVTITDNVINGNSRGIYWYGGSGSSIARNILAHNTGGGIAMYGPVSITNNSFFHNSFSQNTSDKGSALISADATVQGNTFSGHSGVATIGVSSGVLQQNNFLNNLTTFDIYNQTGNTVNATDNWWGTANATTIQNRIFDQTDDIAIGPVNVSPIRPAPNPLAPVAPPIGLVVTAGAGTLNLKWAANTESDIAGYKVYYSTTPGPPYSGAGATQGNSPVDAGKVTSFTLDGLTPGTYFVTVTAYDTSRDGVYDQTDGNESWFAIQELGIAGGGTVLPSATITV
ncbi:MAG: right-handed parallel beta-helix repeat-containing protein, partial [Chloroflexota bacterium]